MLRKLTKQEAAKIHIRDAANLASIVFTAAGWTLVDSYTNFEPPNPTQIREIITNLLRYVHFQNDRIDSGRLMVEKDKNTGEVDIYLRLGELYEGELETV